MLHTPEEESKAMSNFMSLLVGRNTLMGNVTVHQKSGKNTSLWLLFWDLARLLNKMILVFQAGYVRLKSHS